MADYYPLLARAVATLPDSTPEMRRAIYERARKALLTQLRASDPPMSEESLEAESRALDTAVERLEAELSSTETPAQEGHAAAGPDSQHAGYETADAAPEPAAERGPEPQPAKSAPFVAPPQRDPERGPGVSAEPMIAAPARMPGPPRPEAGRERPRPQAPASEEAARGWRRPLVWGPLLVLLLAVAAFAAWQLRVPPQDFAGPDVAQAPAQQQPADPGKINQRADGSSAAAPAQDAPAQQAQTPAASAEIPVAQRAAILVQASPSDSQNVETHVGTTVWRLEPAQRPGADNQSAIRADVDIPPIGMKLAVTIEKNNDPTLRASHTMTLRFSGENGKLPAVAELGTPQMRNETAPTVDPLAGVQAKITDNIFIVALTAEPTFAVRNAELLKTRGWFDFPLRLADGRIAKITIEKGAPGARIFEKAFAEW